MKKKLLFAAYSLDVGGIETALVTLINYLAKKDNEITLVLEKKQGVFLDEIDKNVNVIEYTPSYNKNTLIAKIKNAINRAKFIMKYKNKFDCGISYATYSLSSSFVARTASKNSVLWVHNNYLAFYDYDKMMYKKFFNNINANKFRKIVFVSEEAKEDFVSLFKEYSAKLSVCNNLINYKEIISKGQEKIDFNKNNKITFLNIGRHDEKQKRLSNLILAAKKLDEDGFKFNVVLVGDGNDSNTYKQMVKDLHLEDVIFFEGAKKNPYPYYGIADCVILTSEFEGYPVVYIETLIFNKTIITTNVSDSERDIKDKYGFVCNKNANDIYANMKSYIEHGFNAKQTFNAKEFNCSIIKKLEDIINC